MSDAHDEERAATSLAVAEMTAATIVDDLNRLWESSGIPTRVVFDVPSGAEDQPVFTFTLQLDLPDDFDVDEWPGDDVARLTEAVRERVIGTPVDDWDWAVTARAASSVE